MALTYCLTLNHKKLSINGKIFAAVRAFYPFTICFSFFRLHDVDHCCWSGGFKIDTEGSFHVNMRFDSALFSSLTLSHPGLISVKC